MTEIFREIDEELRVEKLQRVWRRYGVWIVALVVGLVLGTAAYVAWQSYAESRQLERGRAFAAALEQSLQADGGASAETFAELAEGSDGYAVLARLQQAAAKQRAGDAAGAAAIYQALAEDGSVEQQFRELAVILLALATLETSDPDEMIGHLAPLTEAQNPWRYSAQELTALLALRKGDTARAREILTALSQDMSAPAGLQRRAGELLAGLGA